MRPPLVLAAPGPDGVAADAGPRGERHERARARDRGALHAARPTLSPSMAALRAAELIARGLRRARSPIRPPLALGALLAGYASGLAGFAIHHAVCQTIVRMCGTPHAQTNAIMLPHFVRIMELRAREQIERLGAALGARRAPGRRGRGRRAPRPPGGGRAPLLLRRRPGRPAGHRRGGAGASRAAEHARPAQRGRAAGCARARALTPALDARA